MPTLSDVVGNRASDCEMIQGPKRSVCYFQSWFWFSFPPSVVISDHQKRWFKREFPPSSSSSINESLNRRNNFTELRVLVKTFNFKNFWQLVKWRNWMVSPPPFFSSFPEDGERAQNCLRKGRTSLSEEALWRVSSGARPKQNNMEPLMRTRQTSPCAQLRRGVASFRRRKELIPSS